MCIAPPWCIARGRYGRRTTQGSGMRGRRTRLSLAENMPGPRIPCSGLLGRDWRLSVRVRSRSFDSEKVPAITPLENSLRFNGMVRRARGNDPRTSMAPQIFLMCLVDVSAHLGLSTVGPEVQDLGHAFLRERIDALGAAMPKAPILRLQTWRTKACRHAVCAAPGLFPSAPDDQNHPEAAERQLVRRACCPPLRCMRWL